MNKLEITDLSKQFGKTKALDHISVCFEPGIYGLLGHNGAGKSTLMKLICGILDYSEGSIVYNGSEIRSLKSEYRSILGYMPQQQILDSQYTVQSFLQYMACLKGVSSPKEKIDKLCNEFSLGPYKNRRLNALSGGMKQRVLIAQALLNDPQILLLDEPTAGLDPVERKNFRKIISDVSKDKIALLATHMMSDAEFIANRILIMKQGKLLVNATQAELLAQTKVYISKTSAEELMKTDDTIQLVNTAYEDGVTRVRFISKKEYPDRVPTTMDDVYLDWMG